MLGQRYLECLNALLANSHTQIEDIMGVIDAKKLQSSLKLMQEAGGDSVIGIAIDEFYGGELCEQTLKMLS